MHLIALDVFKSSTKGKAVKGGNKFTEPLLSTSLCFDCGAQMHNLSEPQATCADVQRRPVEEQETSATVNRAQQKADRFMKHTVYNITYNHWNF